MAKRLMVFITEGETDYEFYTKLLSFLKTYFKQKKYQFEKLQFKCAKGIGNLQKKIPNIIKNNYTDNDNFHDYDIYVVLAYDKDVFFYPKPPIDRKQLCIDLYALGVKRIIQIEADKTIEDFFIKDYMSILKYLKLPKITKKPPGSGLKVLEKLFYKKSRVYIKGEKIDKFIDCLDFNIIYEAIEAQLMELTTLLFKYHQSLNI